MDHVHALSRHPVVLFFFLFFLRYTIFFTLLYFLGSKKYLCSILNVEDLHIRTLSRYFYYYLTYIRCYLLKKKKDKKQIRREGEQYKLGSVPVSADLSSVVATLPFLLVSEFADLRSVPSQSTSGSAINLYAK